MTTRDSGMGITGPGGPREREEEEEEEEKREKRERESFIRAGRPFYISYVDCRLLGNHGCL